MCLREVHVACQHSKGTDKSCAVETGFAFLALYLPSLCPEIFVTPLVPVDCDLGVLFQEVHATQLEI